MVMRNEAFIGPPEKQNHEGNHMKFSTPAEAFTAKEYEFDDLIQRLKLMADTRFGVNPDDASWAHVGQLQRYIDLLKEVTDIHFEEGEYAQ